MKCRDLNCFRFGISVLAAMLVLDLLAACSESGFTGDGSKPGADKKANQHNDSNDGDNDGDEAIDQASEDSQSDASIPDLALQMVFSIAADQLTLNASLEPDRDETITKTGTKTTQTYHLKKSSLNVDASDTFPSSLKTQIAAAKIEGEVELDSTSMSYKLTIKMIPHTTANDAQQTLPSTPIILTETAEKPAWANDQTDLANVTLANSAGSTQCALLPSGEQPKTGLYATVLTKPAPCRFRMPTVKVGRASVSQAAMTEVAIGTYWGIKGLLNTTVAHGFHVLPDSEEKARNLPLLDNGFILIQPNHKSYLLVDAGLAQPSSASFRDTKTIASQVSQSLGFGTTELLQPNQTTIFEKGSVIALYDDTPDMSGNIDVSALTGQLEVVGLDLSWTASEK